VTINRFVAADHFRHHSDNKLAVNTIVTDWVDLDLNEADGACGSLKPGEPIGDGDDQNRRLSAVAINGLEKWWSSSQPKGRARSWG
jgi:hypothetical protein